MLEAFVKDWLARKKPETNPSTLAFYTKTTGKFLTFLRSDARCEISQITRDHVTRFRNEEMKTLAPKTVNHDLKCLKNGVQGGPAGWSGDRGPN
jgi:hypothetical protein